MSEDDKQIKRLEAIGNIRASGFVTRYAHTSDGINTETLLEIHKQIFKKARPYMAGEYRKEPITIKGSKHQPCNWQQIPGEMKHIDTELRNKITQIIPTEWMSFISSEPSKEEKDNIDQIIEVAAWIHHRVVYIHPFVDGNGRTSRLAANLILQRMGFFGLSIKVERENKNKYCDSLAQIDDYLDYEPLKQLIYEGLIERNNGVCVEYPS